MRCSPRRLGIEIENARNATIDAGPQSLMLLTLPVAATWEPVSPVAHGIAITDTNYEDDEDLVVTCSIYYLIYLHTLEEPHFVGLFPSVSCWPSN